MLEIGEPRYTRRFGDPSQIESVDVLDIVAENPEATIVADLADASEVATASFDCVICPQTLLLIYDLRAAVSTLERIVRPAGAVLATVPGIAQISRSDRGAWEDYWRFTTSSVRRLFEEAFDPENVSVEAHGNVLAATAFLYGLAVEEVDADDLRIADPDYQLVITVRAFKRDARA